MKGRLHTRYAPVRRSLNPKTYTPRLACVKPAASVHPEPGSNSSSYIFILYLDDIYRFFSNLSIPLLLFFLFRFASERLSIQYVYERVFFILRLCFKAGAKVENLFLNGKCFLKFFFRKIFILISSPNLPIYQWTFRVLRGANVTSVFKSHKLFGIFFWKYFSILIRLLVSISVNVYRCCGCKSTTFIYICKRFLSIISIFFKTFS